MHIWSASGAIATNFSKISFLCRWQLNNIGLVLHNQTWHTRHVIVVHMKLSELYSVLSTSRSCLHFFLCNPYNYAPLQLTFLFKFTCLLSFFVCFQQKFIHKLSLLHHFGQKLGTLMAYSEELTVHHYSPLSFFHVYIYAYVYIPTVAK